MPPRTVSTSVESVEALTSRHLLPQAQARPSRSSSSPGQYVDITIPGTEHHRSFSMANTSPDSLEFMIKHYEGGKFSGLLSDGAIKPGDEIDVTGPYGVFTLRPSSPRRLLFIGGGAGMAPILSLLRALQETGSEREAAYYYGARTEADLFQLEELGEPARAASSPPSPRTPTAGRARAGLITDVVDRLEGDIAEVDAYVCGPPPMVEATIALLERKGVPEAHIYYDKFTTTADE